MKLLFDENLSPRLPASLASLFPGSVHVHSCGLGSANDDEIWEYARENGLTIISKDSDFVEKSVLLGSPPKVVWLRASNCSTGEIEHLLRSAHRQILQFIERAEETCLVLGLKSAAP